MLPDYMANKGEVKGQFLPLEGSQCAGLEENMLDLKDSTEKRKMKY